MKRSAVLLAALGLGACSLSSAVTRNSIDYNQTIEDVTNNMLVTNILRARDGVPLYFTDLSQIRGTLQIQTAATIAAPFGNADLSNQRTRNIAGGTLTISTSPSFDLAPLNNKDFSSGLLKPVDLAFLQDYLMQGVPQMLLMHLMVDRIEFVTPPTATSPLAICTYVNTPFTFRTSSAATDDSGPCPPTGFPRGATDFNTLVDSWSLPLIVHSYTLLHPFGPELAFNGQTQVRDLAIAGGSGLVLRPVAGAPGRFQFYKSTGQIAFCIPAFDRYFPASIGGGEGGDAPNAACYDSEVVSGAGDGGARQKTATPKTRTYIYLRSIQGMFQYLGQIMRVEQTNQRLAAQGKPPLPLPLHFHIQQGPSVDARFNVLYGGTFYHIDANGPQDDTLRILAILNQLLNTIKNASEIPSTKAVEALP